MMEPWSEPEPDMMPPAIDHEPSPYICVGQDAKITAQMRDDGSPLSGITACVKYRPGRSASEDPSNGKQSSSQGLGALTLNSFIGKWSTIEMQYNEGTKTYVPIIPAKEIEMIYEAQDQDHAVLEYRIRAVDEAGNENITSLYCVRITEREPLPSPSDTPQDHTVDGNDRITEVVIKESPPSDDHNTYEDDTSEEQAKVNQQQEKQLSSE